MTVYKLTVNLDATLAVQNENGSFNYFKPSIGAEFYTDSTEDLKDLNRKFEDLYAEVIGPNFNSVVNEFLINSDDEKKSDESKEDEIQVKHVCSCESTDACSCKPLEIGMKPESEDTTELPLSVSPDLPKEEWE